MQILINENNKITAYCTVGRIVGGIEIDKSIVPDGFFTDFDSGKWLYVDEAIIPNPDYVPIPEPTPEPPGPSLEEQIEALQEQNQMLTDCILEMSEIVYGGGDT